MSELNRNKFITLIIALLIVFINLIIDHFISPIGIELTPLLIITTTCLVIFDPNKFNIIIKIILIYLFIGLNDIGIKLYGLGFHDDEGQGWLAMFTLVGVIPALIITSIVIVRNKAIVPSQKIIYILLLFSLIILHLNIFKDLGLGRSYPINN